MTVLQQILEHKIVAILRGCAPDRVPDIAAALARGGIRLLEITLNSPGALESIRQLTDRMGDQLLIGAGTVLTAAEGRRGDSRRRSVYLVTLPGYRDHPDHPRTGCGQYPRGLHGYGDPHRLQEWRGYRQTVPGFCRCSLLQGHPRPVTADSPDADRRCQLK